MKGTKKERRLKRHLRNIKKEQEHKKEAWERGAYIEENHNGGPYTEDYTKELSWRMFSRLVDAKELAMNCEDSNPYLINAGGDRNRMYVMFFWKYKKIVQDLILHWSPDAPKGIEYRWLKRLLETYWDDSDSLICV